MVPQKAVNDSGKSVVGSVYKNNASIGVPVSPTLAEKVPIEGKESYAACGAKPRSDLVVFDALVQIVKSNLKRLPPEQ